LLIWNARHLIGTPQWVDLKQAVQRSRPCSFVFSQLRAVLVRQARCKTKGMNICLAILGLQLVAFVISLLRESGEDTRFSGEKLIYRS
jgi:hypothetical protein